MNMREEEDLESGASQGWLPELEVQSYDSDWTEAPAAVVMGWGDPRREPGVPAVGREHRAGGC